MTKSRELDEVQSQDGDVNKRHYGEDVTFYQHYSNLFGGIVLQTYHIYYMVNVVNYCLSPIFFLKANKPWDTLGKRGLRVGEAGIP